MWVGEGEAWPATDDDVVAQFEADYRQHLRPDDPRRRASRP